MIFSSFPPNVMEEPDRPAGKADKVVSENVNTELVKYCGSVVLLNSNIEK